MRTMMRLSIALSLILGLAMTATMPAAAQDDEDDNPWLNRSTDEIVDGVVVEVERIQQEKVDAAAAALNRVLCSLGVTRYCGLSSADTGANSFVSPDRHAAQVNDDRGTGYTPRA